MSERARASPALLDRVAPPRMPGRSLAICNYCLNRNKDECQSECQPEGKYRYLEPEPLPQWEMPPQLPPFRALVDMLPAEALATIWLHVYYLDSA